MRRLAFALLVPLLLAGCAVSAPAAEPTPTATPSTSPTLTTFHILGSVSVPGDWVGLTKGPGEVCTSADGYDDISMDTQITVSDATGAKIAIGRLDLPGGDNRGAGTHDSDYSYCKYPFDVVVPDKGDPTAIYSVHIGNVNRGDISHTRAELDDPLDLTLGE